MNASILPPDACRTGDQIHVIDHDELRMAGPPVSEAQNLIAHREAPDVRAGLHHDAGQITALPGGKCRRPAFMQRARADVRLAGLYPGSADLDQHLTRPGHWPLHLLHPQHIDPAVLVEPHRVITALCRSDKARTAARQRRQHRDRSLAFKNQARIRIPRSTTDGDAVRAQDSLVAASHRATRCPWHAAPVAAATTVDERGTTASTRAEWIKRAPLSGP
ncbi:hypothetical protein BG418_08175 [Streptomyces sp. CBMA152]|nr:hypothetical protein [Streptomyces sp. CBMA152]